MSDRPPGAPNGLKGKLRGFSNVAEIRYELSDVLLHKGVIAELCAWERFTNRYSRRTCVSREIANILRETRSSSFQTLDLSALVDTLERSKVAPTDAEALGRLRLLTEEATAWDADALHERLTKLQFRSETREWVEARKLLALHGSRLDPDEPRRHELSPPRCRLHHDYYMQADGEWPAMVFFRLCRPRMEASTETIAQWVLDAKSLDTWPAAVQYLTEGDLAERVAGEVRKQDPHWLDSALGDSELDLKNKPEQLGVLSRRLLPESQLEVIVRSRGEEMSPGRESETDPYGSDEERMIAQILKTLNVAFQPQRVVQDMRADFWFDAPGVEIVWEHLGHYKNPDYCDAWKVKLEKYQRLGFREGETLFTTRDKDAGVFLSTALAIKGRLAVRAPASPRRILEAIYEWWAQNRNFERATYAKAIYPVDISSSEFRESLSGDPAKSDMGSRALWFTMFALACFQSLGRTQDPQHRGFIQHGLRDGWWRQLAESRPPGDFQPWRDSLERWSEPDRDDQAFLLWKRTLVDLYTIARGLDDYILLIRRLPGSLAEGSGSLDSILRPSASRDAERIGVDAAPINRSLGIGVNWLIRELVRHGVYRREDESLLAPNCWASTQRVRTFLNGLGADVGNQPDVTAGRVIYDFVVEHIGADRARFGGDFDLPLQIVTDGKHREMLERWLEEAGLEASILQDQPNDRDDDS